MRQATERDILRALGESEEEAVGLLFELLGLARADLLRRIAARGEDEDDTFVMTLMLRAVEDATARLRGDVVRTMASAQRMAVRLGAARADAMLPARTVRVLGTFGLHPAVVASVAASRMGQVTRLSDDLRADLRQQIQVAYLGGQTPREAIETVVGTGIEPVGPFRSARARADAIVRTEFNSISNVATWQRGQDASGRIPGLMKRWRAARDGRVRPSHAAANGQTVAMDADFEVGGHVASHPLDPRLPAGERVRCRCTLMLVVPEEVG